MKRLNGLLLPLFVLVFCVSPITCSGANYQMTEEQLTALEWRLNELATDNKTLQLQAEQSKNDLMAVQKQLSESRKQTTELKHQLVESKNEIAQVKQYSNATQELLMKAEKSLNEYEKMEKSKNKRIKWLQIALSSVVVYALAK